MGTGCGEKGQRSVDARRPCGRHCRPGGLAHTTTLKAKTRRNDSPWARLGNIRGPGGRQRGSARGLSARTLVIISASTAILRARDGRQSPASKGNRANAHPLRSFTKSDVSHPLSGLRFPAPHTTMAEMGPRAHRPAPGALRGSLGALSSPAFPRPARRAPPCPTGQASLCPSGLFHGVKHKAGQAAEDTAPLPKCRLPLMAQCLPETLTWTVWWRWTATTFFMQSLIIWEVKKLASPFLSTAILR